MKNMNKNGIYCFIFFKTLLQSTNLLSGLTRLDYYFSYFRLIYLKIFLFYFRF